MERAGNITISELSAEEFRIAGLRIDPAISGPSRQTYNNGFKIMNIDGTNIREIAGMPKEAQLGSPVWCINGTKFAFTNTKSSSIELWVCDVTSLKVQKIADGINLVFGSSSGRGSGGVINWL